MRFGRGPVDSSGGNDLEERRSVTRWQFSGPAFQLLNETGTVEATYAPA